MIIVSADWKPMNAIHQQLMLFLYQWEHVINANIMMCQYSNKILKQYNTAKVLLPKFDKYHKFAVTVHVYVIYTSNGSVNMNNQLGFKLLKQL